MVAVDDVTIIDRQFLGASSTIAGHLPAAMPEADLAFGRLRDHDGPDLYTDQLGRQRVGCIPSPGPRFSARTPMSIHAIGSFVPGAANPSLATAFGAVSVFKPPESAYVRAADRNVR